MLEVFPIHEVIVFKGGEGGKVISRYNKVVKLNFHSQKSRYETK